MRCDEERWCGWESKTESGVSHLRWRDCCFRRLCPPARPSPASQLKEWESCQRVICHRLAHTHVHTGKLKDTGRTAGAGSRITGLTRRELKVTFANGFLKMPNKQQSSKAFVLLNETRMKRSGVAEWRQTFHAALLRLVTQPDAGGIYSGVKRKHHYCYCSCIWLLNKPQIHVLHFVLAPSGLHTWTISQITRLVEERRVITFLSDLICDFQHPVIKQVKKSYERPKPYLDTRILKALSGLFGLVAAPGASEDNKTMKILSGQQQVLEVQAPMTYSSRFVL